MERFLRTITERLRTNRQIIVKKDKSGLSKVLFALRMNLTANKNLPYERHTGQEPHTIKWVLTNTDKPIAETLAVELSNENFESGQDSTALMRERSRGTKL